MHVRRCTSTHACISVFGPCPPSFFLYICPPNCTPYYQGCDKVHMNRAFGNILSDIFRKWLGTALEGLGPEASVPTPTCHEMATWIGGGGGTRGIIVPTLRRF